MDSTAVTGALGSTLIDIVAPIIVGLVTALVVWRLNKKLLRESHQAEAWRLASVLPAEKRFPIYQEAISYLQEMRYSTGGRREELVQAVRRASEWYDRNLVYLDPLSRYLFRSAVSLVYPLHFDPPAYRLSIEGYDDLAKAEKLIEENISRPLHELEKAAKSPPLWPTREDISKRWEKIPKRKDC